MHFLTDEDLPEFHEALLQAGHVDLSKAIQNSTIHTTLTDVSKSVPIIQSDIVDSINNNNKSHISADKNEQLKSDFQGKSLRIRVYQVRSVFIFHFFKMLPSHIY